ncbi:MAG TPA: trehalose-6-phosphate synthase [Solirubrobacteraceae bacterium]|nr:trehalose-6-phosphate synthase [Solirubrobacteraceae bacterium]
MLVSNRGPVTFEADGSVVRGSGGLVTALTGLASHRESVWVASAMNEHDVAQARAHDGCPFTVRSPAGGEYSVRLVESDPEAYDRFYNVFANPMLWFIQHYLWDLSNAPDIRREEIEAFEFGYNVVNEDLARAVVELIEDEADPVVMVHDYHLYTLPALVRKARPDAFLHHFIHIPWTQSDAWRVLPTRIREEIFGGLLANDIIGFHTRSYRNNFLQCCRDLMDLEVDFPRGIVHCSGRDVWVRAYPLPIDAKATCAVAGGEGVAEFERRLLERRRDFLILRVDRADLSKNVLRGFSAFDLFLTQHPEFSERVTFMAQLMPSRMDVAEYAEYLERIEALVAVVNHRHGTPDWMPIQLKLRDDLEEAVAAYKHYDVLLVNAMFDGMNLVAKEGPLVNERHGVSILSENTGAHEELGEFALSVNPFDIQELADSIHAALTMDAEERRGELIEPAGRCYSRPRRDGLDRAGFCHGRPAPHLRPRPDARPGRAGGDARADPQRCREGGAGRRRDRRSPRLGPAHHRLPDRPQDRGRVPPAADACHPGTAGEPPADAAHRRRTRALPDRQARPRHPPTPRRAGRGPARGVHRRWGQGVRRVSRLRGRARR